MVKIYKQNGRWWKPCPSCGENQSYLRKNYAELSLKEGKECKACSNKKPENNQHLGLCKEVLRVSFFNKYRTNASLRNIGWNISEEYAADLLIKQDFKCALSGWDIDALDAKSNTASLDRIDSSEGYVEGNVQWVHKMVNMCKQQYSQEDFINMCEAVANKVKW